MKFILNINKYCLFVLVFSVTFENWDPFKLVGSLSVTYMATAVYFLTWVPLLRSRFQLKSLSKYIIPLGLYVVVGIVSTALNSNYAETIKDLYSQRVVQLIIMMTLVASHLICDPKLIRPLLWTYVSSIVSMYLLFTLGIGVSFEHGRLLIFGENPNLIGMKAVIALLIITAWILRQKIDFKKILLFLILAFPLINLIALSGSRGAFISVFLGLGVLVLSMKMSPGQKLALVAGSVVLSAVLFNYIIGSNDVLRNRMMYAFQTGDIGRNALWNGAIMAIQDNFVIGVGLPGAIPEIYKYSGIYNDPHNVFLMVLLSTGIIGFFFFLIFIFRLGRDLFINYRQTGRVVFLVIYIIILFNMSKAGGGISKILFWFFFGILIGSTFDNTNQPKELTNRATVSE